MRLNVSYGRSVVPVEGSQRSTGRPRESSEEPIVGLNDGRFMSSWMRRAATLKKLEHVEK